ncbi:MAG: PaaI family thioesterase [Pseudomonadota bacterium]
MTLDELAAAHDEVFAPWVKDLGLEPVEIGEDGCSFRLPESARLTRAGGPGGGVVCGQAVSAAADTAAVMTILAVNGKTRPFTTIDLAAHFLRPLPEGEVEVVVTLLSNGKRMASARAEFRAAGGGKLAATVTCAFAYLDL